MDTDLKKNVTARYTWIRALYMLLFAIFYSLAEFVLIAVVLVQFGWQLFTGRPNEQLLKLGQSLATYIYDVVLFLTFKSETHPYPFGSWPTGEPGVSAASGSTASATSSKPKAKAAPKKKASPKVGGEATATGGTGADVDETQTSL